MTCNVVRDLLPAWLDEDESGLSDEQRRLVSSHLETCAECQQALRGLEETMSLVQALPALEMPWAVQVKATALGHRHADALTAVPVRSGAFRASVTPAAAPLAMDSAIPEASPASGDHGPRRRRGRVWAIVAIIALALSALAYFVLR